MSWNGASWNSNANSIHTDSTNVMQNQSQWQPTQQIGNQDNCGQPRTYQSWKTVNGIKSQGQPLGNTQYNTQPHSHHTPANRQHFQSDYNHSIAPYDNCSANFNFNQQPVRGSGIQRPNGMLANFTQPYRNHFCDDTAQNGSNSQYHVSVDCETSGTARHRNITTSTSNINTNRAAKPHRPTNSGDNSHEFDLYQSKRSANRPIQMHQDVSGQQHHNARQQFGNGKSWREGPVRHAKLTNEKVDGPLVRKLQGSMRVITTTTEGIHHWIGSLGENASLIFELFGSVKEVEYGEQLVNFNLKGRTLDIKCVFYCMDQDSPILVNGECVRVVGRLDLNTNKFQCISLRPAALDEKSNAMKLVQSCDTIMQRYQMARNEM